MIDITRLGLALAPLLLLTAGVDVATAQNVVAAVAASPGPSQLSPVDYNFVAEANLGAPFQVDSGRLAGEKATTAPIRDYAHLMVVTHIPVIDALKEVLQHKGITAPPDTLLHGACDTMFARQTLPKIQDHLERALKLAERAKLGTAASE